MIFALLVLAVVILAATTLVRRYVLERSGRLPHVTERQARENCAPLSNAISRSRKTP